MQKFSIPMKSFLEYGNPGVGLGGGGLDPPAQDGFPRSRGGGGADLEPKNNFH